MPSAATALNAAVRYIENRLGEPLMLDEVAGAAHYSKYHLNRLFSSEVGTSLHDYIVRRRLTAAARLLIGGERIIDVAMSCGYGSQQAFSSAFKAMYKATPGEFRDRGRYYPLQLRAVVSGGTHRGNSGNYVVRLVTPRDMPLWMRVVASSVDLLPMLDPADHAARLPRVVASKTGFIAFNGDEPIGVVATSSDGSSIDCLAVSPHYRDRGGYEALVGRVVRDAPREVVVTTFREHDRADTGQRRVIERMGFFADELVVDQGYPARRYILSPKRKDGETCFFPSRDTGRQGRASF